MAASASWLARKPWESLSAAVSSPLALRSARELVDISRAYAQIVGVIPPEPPPHRFVVELSYPERPRVARAGPTHYRSP
jgi:hypothetical protein